MKRKPRRSAASFSLRLTAEMRDDIKKRSDFFKTSQAAYVVAAIQADMSKRPRRPSKQHVLLRTELAKIHAALIELGNRVNTGQVDHSVAKIITDRLVEVVAALLRLEDEVRGK